MCIYIYILYYTWSKTILNNFSLAGFICYSVNCSNTNLCCRVMIIWNSLTFAGKESQGDRNALCTCDLLLFTKSTDTIRHGCKTGQDANIKYIINVILREKMTSVVCKQCYFSNYWILQKLSSCLRYDVQIKVLKNIFKKN